MNLVGIVKILLLFEDENHQFYLLMMLKKWVTSRQVLHYPGTWINSGALFLQNCLCPFLLEHILMWLGSVKRLFYSIKTSPVEVNNSLPALYLVLKEHFFSWVHNSLIGSILNHSKVVYFFFCFTPSVALVLALVKVDVFVLMCCLRGLMDNQAPLSSFISLKASLTFGVARPTFRIIFRTYILVTTE